MLVNCGAGNFKILMISRIENANSCLELLHLALKRRALKGHCGDLGWEKMAFLGEGRQTGICHLVIATLAPLTRKPPFFAFFRGSQVYGLGAKKARLKSKQRVVVPFTSAFTDSAPTTCQEGQAQTALQNLDLTLNQQGAGVRSNRISAQPWVSSAHSRAVVRGQNLTQASLGGALGP